MNNGLELNSIEAVMDALKVDEEPETVDAPEKATVETPATIERRTGIAQTAIRRKLRRAYGTLDKAVKPNWVWTVGTDEYQAVCDLLKVKPLED